MPPDHVVPPTQPNRPIHDDAGRPASSRLQPGLWRAWIAPVSIAAVGAAFLVMTIFGLLGLFGLLSGISSARADLRSTPILLVVPEIGAAKDAVAELPQTSELQTFVDAPVLLAAPALLPVTEAPDEVAPIAVPTPATFRDLFQEVGEAYGIDWRLLAALAFHESSLNPGAVGRDGDMGLMQILPGTWGEFAPPVAAVDPFDPRSNVEVAASYLLYLQDYLDQLGHGEIYWVLAAYNWGPDNVRKLISRGGAWEETPARTRRYVADILQSGFGVRFSD
jgi:soluble lytic murein transglycosylase-like protein